MNLVLSAELTFNVDQSLTESVVLLSIHRRAGQKQVMLGIYRKQQCAIDSLDRLTVEFNEAPSKNRPFDASQ
jgi:hypothetical protein